MTASFISENDSAAVAKKVLTELLDTDKHAPASVIYHGTSLVSSSNPFPITDTTAIPTTAAITPVAQTTSSDTLLSSLATRRGFRIHNDSGAHLYVKYGATAALGDWTVDMPPGSFYTEEHYSGRVDGIWGAAGAGSARVTSLT